MKSPPKSLPKPIQHFFRLPMLRIAFALALSLSVAPLLGWAQGPQMPDSNNEAFRRVSNRVLCQCGCNYMVLSCNMLDCSSATGIRNVIRKSLAAGKEEEVILASFVEEFGPKILAEPPRQGFFWMGWIMPFVVLALGGGLVSYVLWKWHAARKTEAADAVTVSAAAPSSGAVEKFRAQIDKELENS